MRRRQLVLEGAPLQRGQQAVEIGRAAYRRPASAARRGRCRARPTRSCPDARSARARPTCSARLVRKAMTSCLVSRSISSMRATSNLRACPDRLRRRLRDDAERGHGVAGMGLDLEPDAEAVLRLPDRRHLRAAVAGDHEACFRCFSRPTDPTRRRSNRLGTDAGAPRFLRKSRFDIGPGEISAFEQQWFAHCFGEGIGEAIAKIQAGGMTSLAKIEISLPRKMGLLLGD